MRLPLVTALMLTLACSTAAAATAPVVPTRSQHAIHARTAQFSYVPARLPTGWRYYKWSFRSAPRTLSIVFRDRAARELTFDVSQQDGACAEGREKTFQLDGNKVYWAQGADGQQAWRCVTGTTDRLVRIAVGTTMSARTFAPTGLGIVAASGHYVR